jgi:hypothetical protein
MPESAHPSKPHFRWTLPLALGLVVAATTAGAQIHRCTMAEGRVVYSDGACPSNTEKAGTVPGTGRSAASDAERRQLRALEREEMALQRERLALERDRIQVERERTLARRDQAQAERDMQLPAGYGVTIPGGVNSYRCEVATRNLGVGSLSSRARSQREYEMACFGDRAADIQVQRAGSGRYGYGAGSSCYHAANGAMFCN